MRTTQREQTIDLRAASGGEEYTWPLTIVEESVPPRGISTDTIKLSLGDEDTPGVWRTPDKDVVGADAAGSAAGVMNTRTVQILIGGAYRPTPDAYWLWSQTTDTPEIVPRRHFQVTIL